LQYAPTGFSANTLHRSILRPYWRNAQPIGGLLSPVQALAGRQSLAVFLTRLHRYAKHCGAGLRNLQTCLRRQVDFTLGGLLNRCKKPKEL